MRKWNNRRNERENKIKRKKYGEIIKIIRND